MFNRANLLILVVALIGAILGLLASGQFSPSADGDVPAAAGLKPGDMRIDLVLTDLDGKPASLAQFDGKLVLVNFWASWCGPCKEEMPVLDAARSRLAQTGLEIVGVAVDDRKDVADFLVDHPVRYPIRLSDDDYAPVHFGDVRDVLPFSVLIGRDGRILAQRAGNFNDRSLLDWLQPYL